MPPQSTSFAFLKRIAVIHQQQAVILSVAKNLCIHNDKRAVILSAAKNPDAARISAALRTFLPLALALTGCHSAYINATVSNHTPNPISVVQVEYPSASFGTQAIAPGADFHYRFKIIGSGPMKITWTDTAEHEQKATGPILNEGNKGPLTITVSPDGVHWQTPSPTH